MTGAELIALSVAEGRMDTFMQRNHLREKLIDFYEGNQYCKPEYLQNFGFKDKVALPLLSEDLTKRVIDRISMVYKEPPKRTLIEGEKPIEDDGYNEFITANPFFNFALTNAERYKNLLDNFLLRIAYDWESEKQGKPGKWYFYLHTEYIPHFTKENALYPVAYSILLEQDTNSKGGLETLYLFVSNDQYFFHDAHGKKVDHPHAFVGDKMPYARMPVIDFSGFPIGEYWQVGAKTLVEVNQQVNIAQLNILYALHYQSFDQPFVTGISRESDEGIKVGMDTVWELDEGGAAGLLGFNPKLIESTEAIESYIKRNLANYGISANFKEAGNVESGIALQIKNLELLEKRESDIKFYRIKEQEIYQTVKAISDHHGLKLNMPEGAELKVDFSEVELPTAPEEERAQWDWELKHGFVNAIDYLLNKNPDLTEEAAQKILDDNRQVNEANKGGIGIFSQIANGVRQQATNGALEPEE